jgi:3-oxoacyl-[acyl-carrier protein] reductase
MKLEGKVAFVGSCSDPLGIGRTVALTIARMGADVAVGSWNHMEGVTSIVQDIKVMGRKSLAVRIDAKTYPSVQQGFAAIKEHLGPVSILVNNASHMNQNMTIANTTAEEWDNQIQLCLSSAFYSIKEVWADMCANKWGRIINIAPMVGAMTGSVKAGLINLTRSVGLEGVPFDIISNCILVGKFPTHFDLKAADGDTGDKLISERSVAEQKLALVVTSLISDGGGYMAEVLTDIFSDVDLFVL